MAFTLRVLQQADVVQMTDGGEGFCTVLQLPAQVEVAHPVPVGTTGFCHLLFGGQVRGKTDQERQEAPVSPGEAVGTPPSTRVSVTNWDDNVNHSDSAPATSRPGVSLGGHGITALRSIVGKCQFQPVLFL